MNVGFDSLEHVTFRQPWPTAVMVLIAGCPTQTTVNKIQQDPHRFYNKEVALRGTVTESYGALGTGVYQLDDGTGKIWILSENYGVPSKGANVTVTGNVVDTISFAACTYASSVVTKRPPVRYSVAAMPATAPTAQYIRMRRRRARSLTIPLTQSRIPGRRGA